MWIIFSIIASLSQLLRNLYSKKALINLSPAIVTLSRFIFALPVVVLLLVVLGFRNGFPKINNNTFYIWCFLMGISQILATYFRVSLFKYKNFAVSVTLVQVDTVLVAIFGIVFLNEFFNIYSWVGIIIATVGLFLASLSNINVSIQNIKNALLSKSTVIALLTGLFLALAAGFAKKATITLNGQSMVKALFALTFILLIEISILLPVLLYRNPGLIKKIINRPKQPLFIGFFSGIGSFCWITAYSLTNVAYVRVVGQMEFILASLVTLLYFKEKLLKIEFIGILFVSFGTMLLLFFK